MKKMQLPIPDISVAIWFRTGAQKVAHVWVGGGIMQRTLAAVRGSQQRSFPMILPTKMAPYILFLYIERVLGALQKAKIVILAEAVDNFLYTTPLCIKTICMGARNPPRAGSLPAQSGDSS